MHSHTVELYTESESLLWEICFRHILWPSLCRTSLVFPRWQQVDASPMGFRHNSHRLRVQPPGLAFNPHILGLSLCAVQLRLKKMLIPYEVNRGWLRTWVGSR